MCDAEAMTLHRCPKRHGCWLLVVLFTVGVAWAQVIEKTLEGRWLFRLGDDLNWADPALPETLWFPIRVPNYWENQNYELYDGYAWYRLTVTLDSTYYQADSLILDLGKIDDVDETYWNGIKIGGRGSFPPEFISAKNESRRYKIPRRLLRNRNILTVRVYDDSQNGGIYRGPLRLRVPAEEIATLRPGKNWRNSVWQLPFTNGVGAGSYNIKSCSFTHFFPHLYRRYSEQQETRNLIKEARAVVYYGKKEMALNEFQTVDVGYIEGTGIIKHVLTGKNLTLTQYAFCPFSVERPLWVYYLIAEGAELDSIALNFWLQTDDLNLDIGKWAYQDNRRKWLTVFVYYRTGKADEENFLIAYKQSHSGFAALLQELDWWNEWQRQSHIPEGLDAVTSRVYRQSLALLKMAQCREDFPAGGQIVAALPPSSQNYCWVRDQAHATEALILTGHYAEAKAALQFLLNSRAGRFKQYQWNQKPVGIGKDYAVSIFRYWGNGIEQTVSDENGLTQHLDGFGLTLWNLRHYAEASGDYQFISYYWQKISRQIADVLPALIDETGLVRAEPGPWEKSIPFKHYLYTNACTYRGLIDAAQLARMMNDEERAAFYEQTAINLRIAIEKNLIDDNENCLKGIMEERDPHLYMDASIAEALIWIFNPQDQIHRGTLKAIQKYLAFDYPRRGFRRNRIDLSTTNLEWVYGDLRMIGVLLKAVNFTEALDLQQWITTQADNNFGLLPQYFDTRDGSYFGVVPRSGLGAGIYIQNFFK